MLVVRPATTQDLDGIIALANRAEFGLTTLPKNREVLQRRLENACRHIALAATQPGGENYLFVGEVEGRLVGTSGIVSRVGGFEPFYTYHIKTTLRQSTALETHKEIPVLHLMAEHDGPSEIGTLFLDPDRRRSGYGSLLSKARFLFMAQFRQAFSTPVIAELRGVVDEKGHSPFWEAVGRHFFDVDFHQADYQSVQDKQFIAELMPEHPLYIPLLPPEAQAVIGQVHQKTRPALEILRREGFKVTDHVDIFDAGPLVSCPLDQIRTVQQSQILAVQSTQASSTEQLPYLLCNTPVAMADFRACIAQGRPDPGGISLPSATAAALNLAKGDSVRAVALNSQSPTA